jgi:predicted  nucleic acid-binding Zn-ribbon protein
MPLNLQERVDILEARTDSLEDTLGALNLQERVGALETKTDSLEDTVGLFITAVNRTMMRLENDTLKFRREMKDFRDNTERSLTRLENDTLNFRREMKDFKDEMRDFKDEMRDFKDEMKDFRNRTEADMKKFQRELREEAGRVDNKMGTLVEHMIAPGIPGIAKTYFGDNDLTSFSIRVRRKSMGGPPKKREFDVIAFSEKNFYVTETKSDPKPELAKKFADGLPELPDYFPEYRDKNIIPIFSSLFIPENVKTFLSRRGIYAMGLHEDTMDLLNFDEVKRES